MQSKGWIRLVAILLAIASIWQLSFTAVTSIQEKKAARFAEKAAVAAQNSAAFAQIPENDQAYYLDSIRKEQNRVFIDSISSKKRIPLEHLQGVQSQGDQPWSGPQGWYERHAAGAASGSCEGHFRQQHES